MREAELSRNTKETRITGRVQLDVTGPSSIHTNLPLFTHFLTAFATHSGLVIDVDAEGDVEIDPHHLVEDVGIVLGQCLDKALGNRAGITRFGQRLLPMDEALILCAIDISGRGRLYWDAAFPDHAINGVEAEVWPEFFNALAANTGMTLHLRCVTGTNTHHIYEASFKATGRALAEAVALTGLSGIPSTKGVL